MGIKEAAKSGTGEKRRKEAAKSGAGEKRRIGETKCLQNNEPRMEEESFSLNCISQPKKEDRHEMGLRSKRERKKERERIERFKVVSNVIHNN